MSVFSAAELAALQAEFPKRDVARLAAAVEKKHAKIQFRFPDRVLRAWLENAEKNDSDRIDEAGSVVVASEPIAGMFRADGSWAQNGYGDAAMHRLVDMLVTARRRGYDPARIAARIKLEPGWEKPFPNAETWASESDWNTCPCATSAEQCVKAAGRGSSVRDAALERSDPTYAAFRFGVVKQVLGGLSLTATADLLEQHAPKFADLPGVPELLEREIAAYRGMGDTWQPASS